MVMWTMPVGVGTGLVRGGVEGGGSDGPSRGKGCRGGLREYVPYSKEYQKGGLARAAALLAFIFAAWFADVEAKLVGMICPKRFMKSVKFF